MKQKVAAIFGTIVVLALIFISVKYFRNGSPSLSMNNKTEENFQKEGTGRLPMQDGEPDEIAKKMAKEIADYKKEQYAEEHKVFLGEDEVIEPEQVVSTGKIIRKGDFSYKVNSWEITKENPGYPRHEDMLGAEYYGLELDENGNLINDFSYVVVNIEIENLAEEPVTEYLWSYFNLGILGAEFEYDMLSKEVLYLGENPPREHTKSYYMETVSANGKIEMPLIYIAKDEALEGKQPYIEINTRGAVGYFSDLRFIILN